MSSLTHTIDAYLTAWKNKDIDAIAACMHPNVHFKGPMVEFDGIGPFLASGRRILPMLVDFRVRAVFESGDTAMIAYDFLCSAPIGNCRTAELVTLEDGLIRDVELFYDARPFELLTRPASGGN